MAVITVYTGVLAGHIIVLNKSSKPATITRLLILAVVTVSGYFEIFVYFYFIHRVHFISVFFQLSSNIRTRIVGGQ